MSAVVCPINTRGSQKRARRPLPRRLGTASMSRLLTLVWLKGNSTLVECFPVRLTTAERHDLCQFGWAKRLRSGFMFCTRKACIRRRGLRDNLGLAATANRGCCRGGRGGHAHYIGADVDTELVDDRRRTSAASRRHDLNLGVSRPEA